VAGNAFTKDTGIELHYAGVPFVRSQVTATVKDELRLFLILSAIVTVITLYAFFRAFDAVVISMLAVGIVVVWAIGSIDSSTIRLPSSWACCQPSSS
jgi:predicted RND superfamily exporter protein